MGAETKIEWADMTFNPWRGCQKIAPGCKNCYAETLVNRFGDFGKRIRLSDAGWKAPLKWNREAILRCADCGNECNTEQAPKSAEPVKHPWDFECNCGCNRYTARRPRVFCASLADVFEDWQGRILDHHGNTLQVSNCRTGPKYTCGQSNACRFATLDDLRRDLFALIDATPNLDWLLLTKRPENIRRMWPTEDDGAGGKLAAMIFGDGLKPAKGRLVRRRNNVWLLTSVSDQATADAAIPELLKCRDLVPVLGVSYEPALGPVDFMRACKSEWRCQHCGGYYNGGLKLYCSGCGRAGKFLDWIIFGGESGHNARPCDVAWARSTVEQCRAAGVPCFVKQLGGFPLNGEFGVLMGEDGEQLKDKKGGDWLEWPEGLRARQFPAFDTKGGGE